MSCRGHGRHRAQTGLTLLELVVSITVSLLVAGVLLDRFLFYQEVAEKARIELEIVKLKLALQVRVGALIAEHRQVDYAAMVRENPVRWLDEPMAGYRGEPGPAEATLLPGGVWYFDREQGHLVYLLNSSRHFIPDSQGRKRIRLMVRTVRAGSGARRNDQAVIGLQVVPVEPYRWF
jgi:general secretion pathway protein G